MSITSLKNEISQSEAFWNSFYQFESFNIDSPEEAELYLLGEIHSNPLSRAMEVQLIHRFASAGPLIVLVEGQESGKVMDDSWKRAFSQKRQYDETDLSHIQFIGWDLPYDELVKRIGTPPHMVANLVREIEHTYNDWKTTCEKLAKLSPDLLRSTGTGKLDKEVDETKIDSLELELRIEALDHIIHFIKLKDKIADGMALHTKYRATPHIEGSIETTFQERTESMLKTIDSIKQIKTSLKMPHAKVVLLSGASHLIPNRQNRGNPNFDLNTLYEKLESHKAVILMAPHVWEELK